MSDPSMIDVLAELRRIRIASKAGLKFSEAVEYIGFSESTVRRMLKQPGAPKCRAFQTDEDGNTVKMYLRAEIDEWMKSAPISRAS